MKNLYTEEDIVDLYRNRLLNTLTEKDKKNPNFVEQLLNLTANQIRFETVRAKIVIGHTISNVTSVGETEYTKRTINIDYTSPTQVFLIEGDDYAGKIATKAIDSLENKPTQFNDKAIEDFTYRWSRRACDQDLADMNFRQTSHRVNRFKFCPETDEFIFSCIKIFAKIKDEKGNDKELFVGTICPSKVDDNSSQGIIYNNLSIPLTKKAKIKKAVKALTIILGILVVGAIIIVQLIN